MRESRRPPLFKREALESARPKGFFVYMCICMHVGVSMSLQINAFTFHWYGWNADVQAVCGHLGCAGTFHFAFISFHLWLVSETAEASSGTAVAVEKRWAFSAKRSPFPEKRSPFFHETACLDITEACLDSQTASPDCRIASPSTRFVIRLRTAPIRAYLIMFVMGYEGNVKGQISAIAFVQRVCGTWRHFFEYWFFIICTKVHYNWYTPANVISFFSFITNQSPLV